MRVPPVDPSVREELRALLRLSWPITVAQLGLMTMGLVDTAVLGRVSVTELAGSSIGRAVGFASITPAMGIALALEPLASQAVGAGELGRAWESLRATSRAVLIAGGPLIAIGVGALFFLEACGVDPAIAERARAYAITQSIGMLLSLVFLTHKTFLQSQGHTRPALVASVIANLVNLVVCNLLVRGDEFLTSFGLSPLGLPRLGAFGAGIAFSIAGAVMAAIVVAASSALRPLAVTAHVPVRTVIALGMPVGLQLLAEVGVFALCTVLVGRFGPAATSAHQVALGLASFTFMGAVGFSGGAAVRVGYAVGEGRSPRRAGLIGLACGAIFMAAAGVLFAAFPEGLVRLFTSDPAVIELGARLVIIAAFFQLFDGLQAVGGGALRGAGDVRFPFVATVAAHWAVGFPAALILGFVCGLGVRGIWWGLASGLITVSVLLVTRFLRLTRGTIARV
jgi:MATE family multidrug resistance protein